MNLFDHLATKYVAEYHVSPRDATEFINFCRRQMEANPVVSTAPVEYGVGLRLQDGTVVSLMSQPSSNPSYSIPISNPGFTPGMHGITDTRAIQITNPDRELKKE